MSKVLGCVRVTFQLWSQIGLVWRPIPSKSNRFGKDHQYSALSINTGWQTLWRGGWKSSNKSLNIPEHPHPNPAGYLCPKTLFSPTQSLSACRGGKVGSRCLALFLN